MYFENREQFRNFNIPKNFFEKRQFGLSAMIRIKNEEEWIKYSLLSIKDLFDEIIVIFQNSSDRSEQIVQDLQIKHLKVFQYPFDSYKHGPGFNLHGADSVYSQSYYYNWCLSKTTKSWVCKWDGDMVAMDWLCDMIIDLIKSDCYDLIKIRGVNIVGEDCIHVGKKVYTGWEPRFFKVSPQTYYFDGPVTQIFNIPKNSKIFSIKKASFLHFKWAKSLESATKIWPKNYKKMPLFKNLLKRRIKHRRYIGEYPQIIQELVDAKQKN